MRRYLSADEQKNQDQGCYVLFILMLCDVVVINIIGHVDQNVVVSRKSVFFRTQVKVVKGRRRRKRKEKEEECLYSTLLKSRYRKCCRYLLMII